MTKLEHKDISTVTDGLGHVTDYDYTDLGYMSKTTDAIGKVTNYYYDSYMRQTKVAAGTSGTYYPTEYYFDPGTNRMTRASFSGWGTEDTYYRYDYAGRLTQVDGMENAAPGGTANAGHFFEQDKDGRTTKYRDYDDDPSGTRRMLQYTYDAAGRVLTMKDYDGYDTLYTYTAVGQVSTMTAPGAKVWDYDYNALGQPTKVTLPNGMATEYSYDGANRMTKLEHKDGSTVKLGFMYALTAGGQITRITHQDGAYWDYGNDGRGRLTSAVRKRNGGAQEASQTYAYDAGDNMTTKETRANTPVLSDDFSDGNYTSNPAWSVSGSWSAASYNMQNTALDASWRSFWPATGTADGAVSFTYTLESGSTSGDPLAVLRLRNTDWDNHVQLKLYSTTAQLIQRNGGTQTTLDSDAGVDSTLDQAYDVLVLMDGADIEVWRGESGGALSKVLETSACSVTSGTGITFSAGEYTYVTMDGIAVSSLTEGAVTFQYSVANELTSQTSGGTTTTFSYGLWGELTGKSQGAYSASYQWRYGQKLSKVTSSFPGEGTVQYGYRGDGKRAFRLESPSGATTKYNYDKGWNVQSEDDAGNNLVNTFTYDHPMAAVAGALAEIAGSNPSTGTAKYYFRDHLGSTRRVHAADKSTLATTEHQPYGDTYASTGTQPRFTFTGKPWDASAGMYWFPYRYYSPQMSRWISRDPLGMVDGPNVYGYVTLNPVVNVDILGGSCWWALTRFTYVILRYGAEIPWGALGCAICGGCVVAAIASWGAAVVGLGPVCLNSCFKCAVTIADFLFGTADLYDIGDAASHVGSECGPRPPSPPDPGPRSRERHRIHGRHPIIV